MQANSTFFRLFLVFDFSAPIVSLVHFQTMDGPLHIGAPQWPSSDDRTAPLGAGTTGGTNEEKLDKTEHVPGCCGLRNFAVSAC